MKTVAFFLALSLACTATAGEIVKRELGTDSNGDTIEGYVFQADSRHRRGSSNARRVYRPSYFAPAPVVIRSSPNCRTTTVRTGPPVIVVPRQTAPIRARIIIVPR